MANSYNLYKVESLKAKRYTLQSSNPTHPTKERVNHHHNFSLTLCYGKIYWFFCVVVIRNIFTRKLSHLAISSPFILVNQKSIKPQQLLEQIFVVTRFHHMHLPVGTFVIYYQFFQVNISVNGLSGNIGFHGSQQLSLYS